MTLIYKPIGLILGIIGGLVGRQAFNQVWQRVDDEEPPEPTTRDSSLRRVIFAVALQGMIFSVVKALIAARRRADLEAPPRVWPGEKRPDPS